MASMWAIELTDQSGRIQEAIVSQAPGFTFFRNFRTRLRACIQMLLRNEVSYCFDKSL
jgi:hypothetical protein